MPNLLAHSLVVKRFYIKEDEMPSVSKTQPKPFIKGNFAFLSLGSQGPDPLFYVGIIPFHALHLVTANKRLGNKLHKQDGKKYFRLLVEQSYMIDDDLEKCRFQSFIFGQLAHYLLDREAHPYVLYETGFDEDGRITGKYHYLHTHFEAEIDTSLAMKYRMNYFLSNPSDFIPTDKDFLKIIDRNLVPVLKKLFDEKNLPANLYSNAIINMHSWVRYINKGNLRAKMFGKSSLSALKLPINKADTGCLNETKETWLDPVTGAKRNDSFIEIHSRAFELLDSCYHDILKNGFNYDVIQKYLNGLDYYGAPVGSKWLYKKN
jgi:hypothetical protein